MELHQSASASRETLLPLATVLAELTSKESEDTRLHFEHPATEVVRVDGPFMEGFKVMEAVPQIREHIRKDLLSRDDLRRHRCSIVEGQGSYTSTVSGNRPPHNVARRTY